MSGRNSCFIFVAFFRKTVLLWLKVRMILTTIMMRGRREPS
jgi:hypothetical protein